MRFLMTEEMKLTKPESVRLLFEAKDVGVVCEVDGVVNERAHGSHVMVDGDVDTLRGWLSPFSPIWHTMPGTSMQEESFILCPVDEML